MGAEQDIVVYTQLAIHMMDTMKRFKNNGLRKVFNDIILNAKNRL